ncbi:hypothetical protein D043_1854B, partial [Vibrio parahaemolyticus EKP-021]
TGLHNVGSIYFDTIRIIFTQTNRSKVTLQTVAMTTHDDTYAFHLLCKF